MLSVVFGLLNTFKLGKLEKKVKILLSAEQESKLNMTPSGTQLRLWVHKCLCLAFLNALSLAI